jgi:hypothetical protein
VVPEWPRVYWWKGQAIEVYKRFPLIGDVSPACAAQSTGDNTRFVRYVWEIGQKGNKWSFFLNGAQGRQWLEPALEYINWKSTGLEIKESKGYKNGTLAFSLANEDLFLRDRGIAFSMVGSSFMARSHVYPSVLGDKGSSVYPKDIANAVCAMNTSMSKYILESLNPSISFQVGDVNRLPLFVIQDSGKIYSLLENAFNRCETHREASIEFCGMGPSPWRHAQDWAQQAVDRPEGAPLPEYIEELDPEPPTDHLSFALGARRAFLQTQALSSQALVEGFQRCSLLWPEKALLSGGITIRQLPALLDAT